MKWSWKIARIAGIDIYMHATFLLLVMWFGFYYWKTFGTVAAAVNGMLYIIALFGCVVLHEFGHALTARRYGIVTRHITLLPIGGVASLERMPEKPRHEILVAIAGPAVNIVIASILWLWLHLNNTQITTEELMTTGGPFAFRLMVVNIFLAVFNLLPAFPMDGGRVLRAALATRMPHAEATRRASIIGQNFALLFGVLGLFYNPFLLLIAVFLWFGASAENQLEQTKVALHDLTAEQAMLTEFHILSPDDTLNQAIDYTLASTQRDFPIGTTQHLTHVLSQKDLLQALQQFGSTIRLGQLQLPEIHTVPASSPIQKLMTEMPGMPGSMVAVEKNNRVIGIVDLENIIELMRINQALYSQKEF